MKKKKEEKESELSKTLFILLLGAAVGVFGYILFTQPPGTYSMTDNKLRSSNSSSSSNSFKMGDNKRSESAPSELKWVDSFKGIGNE